MCFLLFSNCKWRQVKFGKVKFVQATYETRSRDLMSFDVIAGHFFENKMGEVRLNTRDISNYSQISVRATGQVNYKKIVTSAMIHMFIFKETYFESVNLIIMWLKMVI